MNEFDTRTLDEAKYISLATFRADGSSVATPVWLRGSNGSYDVITGENSHKVSRIKSDPRVEIAPCDVRGNVSDGAARFAGTALLVNEPTTVTATVRAVHSQYAIMGRLLPLMSKVRSFFPGGGTPDYVVAKLTITKALDRS